MLPVDRQQREAVDQLVEDFTQKGLSRREFMKRGLALGLSATAAGAILDACGGNSSGGSANSVDVLNVWSGPEAASFEAMMAPFTQQTGIKITVETTRDLNAVLTTRIRGNNPPDIAILPNPAKMQELAKQGKLIALDGFLDMTKIHSDYASTWTDLGAYNGKLYAIFMKAANKGTIWYNPAQASAAGLTTPPATFADLITLSTALATAGKYPWSMGVSSGSASGWPAADWIDEIYLLANGPAMYDKWVAHQIPWTDSSVKQAFLTFGQIAHGKHYINGAPASILATGFSDATYALYNNPPTAYLNYLGDFAATFIKTQFPSLQPGTGYNFFPFPSLGPNSAGAVTVGADVVVAMRNNNAVQKFVQYVATAEAQSIWVKRGGFISVNKSVSIDSYPDSVSKASAQMLVSATTGRFGADDLMPSQVETAYWKACLDYLQTPGSLDSILSTVESTAMSAYTS